MASWLLIHSPLVVAATWTPTAAQLRQLGHDVVVPDLTPALASDQTDHASRQADLVVASVESGPVVLVGHSGAGPLLPVIADRLVQQRISVTASVFVDAGLPHPGRSRLDVSPAALVEQLRQMTVDGWLPPWASWWPPEILLALLPERHQRDRLVQSSPRLPVTLFDETLPAANEGHLGVCCYLRLSSAYDDFATRAERAGWPIRRIDAHHLAILTAPQQIAETLQALVRRAGV